MATIKIKWTVTNLANVLLNFDVCKVYRSATRTGTYAEITGPGSRVALVDGTTLYTYDDLAGDTSYWYKVSYFHTVSLEESAASDAIQGAGGGNYVSIQGARDAGFSESLYTDTQLLDAILDAEAFIEGATGRWFYPRQLKVTVNGSGSHVLPLGDPVIQVDGMRVLGYDIEFGSLYGTILPSSVKVSNRHLTQGLREPDDREDPRLEFEAVFEDSISGISEHVYNWDEGAQNVEIEGWFGFTELQPGQTPAETSEGSQIPVSKGSCPRLIRRATLLLLPRYLASPADPEAYSQATRGGSVKRMKVRDQEIEYSDATASSAVSGDTEIDRILSMYSRATDVCFF